MDQSTHSGLNAAGIRQAGADAIAAHAIEIASESGVVVTRCVWDLGQDYSLQHAHRLDIFTEARTVRLYLPDIELTGAENEVRAKRTEERLRSAISQLLPRPPTATYAFN